MRKAETTITPGVGKYFPKFEGIERTNPNLSMSRTPRFLYNTSEINNNKKEKETKKHYHSKRKKRFQKQTKSSQINSLELMKRPLNLDIPFGNDEIMNLSPVKGGDSPIQETVKLEFQDDDEMNEIKAEIVAKMVKSRRRKRKAYLNQIQQRARSQSPKDSNVENILKISTHLPNINFGKMVGR